MESPSPELYTNIDVDLELRKCLVEQLGNGNPDDYLPAECCASSEAETNSKDMLNITEHVNLVDNHEEIQNQLLQYFNQKRALCKDFNVDGDARKIAKIFPRVTLERITDLLTIYIDLHNRIEIVLRFLGYENDDREQGSNQGVKRLSNEITDIPMKIPKLSTKERIAEENQIQISMPLFDNNNTRTETSSSSSVKTERFHVQDVGLTTHAIIHNSKNEEPSTSGATSNIKIQVMEAQPSMSINDLPEDGAEKLFNLVDYLQQLTQASEKRIIAVCKNLMLPIDARPSDFHIEIIKDCLLRADKASPQRKKNITPTTTNVSIGLCSKSSSSKALPAQGGTAIVDLTTGKFSCQLNASTQPTSERRTHRACKQTKLEVTPIPGPSTSAISTLNVKIAVNQELFRSLCQIFTDACPEYLKSMSKVVHPIGPDVLNEVISQIIELDGNYPKRPRPEPEPEENIEVQYEIIKEVLPDADPDYLQMICEKYAGKRDEFKMAINEAVENGNYPTLKDYQRRQQLSAQQRQYTTEFSVENFVKLFPDPLQSFSDKTRKIKNDNLSTHAAILFLRNHFNRLSIRTIQEGYQKSDCSLIQTAILLERLCECPSSLMKSKRKPTSLPNITNVPLLQEIAYISHKAEIVDFLKKIKENEEKLRQEVKDAGRMKSCGCCFDDEVMPTEVFTCTEGCEFCKNCVTKSVEVLFGEGKLHYPCLAECQAAFSLQTLQAVLTPKLFSKVAQKKALEEFKAAGIDDLEMCPFCDFATILPETDKVFKCLDPYCMKESCRLCKEPSHIPLRCDEIEKDEDVKARTFIENKMTEALLRKCWKCGIKFYKIEGCNKMTCSCGAQMCYICNQPVKDYKHFNGQGGDRHDLCPLYSDSDKLNIDNVMKGAAAAKTEIGVKELKIDPAANFPVLRPVVQHQRNFRQ